MEICNTFAVFNHMISRTFSRWTENNLERTNKNKQIGRNTMIIIFRAFPVWLIIAIEFDSHGNVQRGRRIETEHTCVHVCVIVSNEKEITMAEQDTLAKTWDIIQFGKTNKCFVQRYVRWDECIVFKLHGTSYFELHVSNNLSIGDKSISRCESNDMMLFH